ADMVGQALQFEGDSPQDLRPSGFLCASEGLKDPRVSRGVGNRRIACQGFHVVDGPLIGTAQQRALHSSVLISEGDLQMEDLLPMTLEPEVARLDHSGMD